MMFLKQYWSQIAAFIFGLALSWLICDHFQTAEITHLNELHAAALQEQKTALENDFNAKKGMTEDVAKKYESERDALAAQLAAAKRVRPNRCLPLDLPAAAGKPDAAPAAGEPAEPGTVASWDILDLGNDGQVDRDKLRGLQIWVLKAKACMETGQCS